MVSRHGEPCGIVPVEPFVSLHEVESPLLDVAKQANLHWIEEARHWEIAQDTGIISKHVESSVNMAQWEFRPGFRGVGIAELSI